MPPTNQEKGQKCQEHWEHLIRASCPVSLEPLRQGADYKCENTFYEVKSCRSGLTKKQREMKEQVEKSGGKYLVLRCAYEK